MSECEHDWEDVEVRKEVFLIRIRCKKCGAEDTEAKSKAIRIPLADLEWAKLREIFREELARACQSPIYAYDMTRRKDEG
jgi:hypothetical protein